ncbi:beta-ketoacyl synthase N-terminal-like domain-containing protein [Pontibacter beigongshangensis]|uniref:beta-ketoacyl synthase N-terminal-like domain-containing protein n=1 Tax=Pontibacter beigongshangensis TaxID=2574733 RepID=UPI0016501BBE|nr:beta-ketoacyl synthase N-terminal-like domain-containing protein [Pontibacter beigongshangensis]
MNLTQKEYIVIRGYGSLSSMGHGSETVAGAYRRGQPAFQMQDHVGMPTPVAALPSATEAALRMLAQEKKAYQALDRSVLMAILAGRQAVAAAGWASENEIAVNIGSSRGATGLFEQYVQEFQQTGTVPSHTSPVTTLGNVSSWVAQDLGCSGATLSHSVTCSTGIQAIANAFAWLKSGMAARFLAGAAEAPLTPFTIAQMKAIGIYTPEAGVPFPCRPHNAEQKNTFVLGEGAAVFALERATATALATSGSGAVLIEAVGFGFETIGSKTGISRDGANFKKAMQDALQKADSTEPIDLVIMHAPGTIAGDAAEWQALLSVFGEENMPAIASTKWLTGHTLGASACLSMEYALHVLQQQEVLSFPYATRITTGVARQINRILITAAGFGGNAAALLLRRSL